MDQSRPAMYLTVAAAAILFSVAIAAPRARAQAQPGSQPEPNRAELVKIKPDFGGFRNGVFIEPDPMDFADHAGYTAIFDGKTLTDWDGIPGVWSVQEGAIVGESSAEKNAGNSFIVYHGAEAHDFDLKLEIKVEKGGGSGIQYRSSLGIPAGRVAGKGEAPLDPRWIMIGPQADFWFPVNEAAKQYSGQLYSQNTGKGIVVWRGQVVQSLPDKPIPKLVGVIGDRNKLGAFVKDGEWNQYTIMARGGVVIHILNGQLMAVLVDDDPASSNNVSGLIGLQIEGIPCKVSFRNLWLKKIN